MTTSLPSKQKASLSEFQRVWLLVHASLEGNTLRQKHLTGEIARLLKRDLSAISTGKHKGVGIILRSYEYLAISREYGIPVENLIKEAAGESA